MSSLKRKNETEIFLKTNVDEKNREEHTLKKLKNLSIKSQEEVEVEDEYKDFLFWKNWILL
jgi:uncharacterized protein involved in tolerance to divalent cations